jgi:hypothetical protein
MSRPDIRCYDDLVKACPLLFAGRDTYLFECMEGWLVPITELCLKLEALIEAIPEEERYICWEDEESGEQHKERTYTVAQIKEKYATLRFYMYGHPDGADDLIAEAELASSKTCEQCGKPGEVRNTGYYQTMCDEHLEEYLAKRDALREKNRLARESKDNDS